VVATIGGQPVSWSEVFESAAPDIVQAEEALYEARRQAVDGLIMQKLVDAEAAKTGQTADQYVRAEVSSKAPPVTDDEIKQFYLENQDQMQGGTLDQMKGQIGQYLEQQHASDVIRALVDRLKAENNVQVTLPRYRLDVSAANSPRLGPATAPVQIVEFSDFQCPYCQMAAKTVHEIQEKYGDKVSIVFRNFPLPMHPQAGRAAEAAQCANDQGGFWKYHDALFADRKAWTDDDFKGYAKASGLDVKQFGKCLDGGAHKATIDADIADGKKVGMNGTPGFYVNGIVLSGARPIEDFVEVIDSELARAGG
jgi:protein-disulfide isomerase